MLQAACRKSQQMFLTYKVFNISVDNLVENLPAALHKLPQFNTLPCIALFVCNIDASCSVETAADTDGERKTRKVEFSTRRMMFHGMFHRCFALNRTKDSGEPHLIQIYSEANRRTRNSFVIIVLRNRKQERRRSIQEKYCHEMPS